MEKNKAGMGREKQRRCAGVEERRRKSRKTKLLKKKVREGQRCEKGTPEEEDERGWGNGDRSRRKMPEGVW
jgi:hypothetical protein